MKYHTPHILWSRFNAPDFESYIERFVIKSHFHKDVPVEVVDDYSISEHIMAFAYYHYPLMDEALVKLLRVLEMAVKIRCGQLKIELFNGKKRRKNLDQLMGEVSDIEAVKDLKSTLTNLRKLRNHFMHPDRVSLFGTVALNAIKSCVIVLNALFLPEQYFSDAKTEIERIKSLWRTLENGLFVLEYDGFRYVLYKSEVIEVYWTGHEWVYCCAFYAIPADIRKMLAEDRYPSPFVLLLKNLKFGPGTLEAIEVDTESQLSLSTNEHPDNIAILINFQAEMAKMDEPQPFLTNGSIYMAINKMQTDLRYKYWGR